ncbi:MAG: PEP-utilizing enzyme [Anaerotruncus sp.]|nr:PEP-utilizing enzyme [Anaerotruncus sp.]
MRRCLLALGARLVGRGVLGRGRTTCSTSSRTSSTRSCATGRKGRPRPPAGSRRRRAELAARRGPRPARHALRRGDRPALEPPTAEGLEPSSPASARARVCVKGRARVVRDPAPRDRPLRPAATSSSCPSPTSAGRPLLAGVGGIVAETGGQLSHTSIIAREYGIPAVVSVRNATRLVRDGQSVTVDGTAGRVYLHPDGTE